MRNHGLKNRNQSIYWGTNSRLDNLQAAFGNIMIKKINNWNKKFLKIANHYSENLKNFVNIPKYEKKISIPTFHQYIIRTKERDKLRSFLSKKDQTAIHYPIPIHKQKAFINNYGKIKLKNFEKYEKQILSLPIHAYLKQKEINYVCENIKIFFFKI